MDVLCTLRLKIESQKLDHGCIKDKCPYPNQDRDAKPQSGTSSILQSPKWGLKGHECSLHLQNQDSEPKFGTWVYERPVTISKQRLRYQTPVRNILHPPKPQIRTSRTLIFFVPSKSRQRTKIRNMGHGTNDNIQIKIKMQNPNKEPEVFSKSVHKESLENGCLKDQLP